MIDRYILDISACAVTRPNLVRGGHLLSELLPRLLSSSHSEEIRECWTRTEEANLQSGPNLLSPQRLQVAVYGVFRPCVGPRERNTSLASGARHHRHQAGLVGHHVLHHGPRQVDHGEHVQVEYFQVDLRADVLPPGSLAPPCIVDQDVQPTKNFQNLIEVWFVGGKITEIHRENQNVCRICPGLNTPLFDVL